MYCQRNSDNSTNRIHERMITQPPFYERALRIAYNDYMSTFKGLSEKDNSVTIHQRNIRALALEIFKTKHNLTPSFMKEILCPVNHSHNTRNHNLAYPNPNTFTYGLETFGYKAQQKTEKKFQSLSYRHKPNLCMCNLCRLYISNLGYVQCM